MYKNLTCPLQKLSDNFFIRSMFLWAKILLIFSYFCLRSPVPHYLQCYDYEHLTHEGYWPPRTCCLNILLDFIEAIACFLQHF